MGRFNGRCFGFSLSDCLHSDFFSNANNTILTDQKKIQKKIHKKKKPMQIKMPTSYPVFGIAPRRMSRPVQNFCLRGRIQNID